MQSKRALAAGDVEEARSCALAARARARESSFPDLEAEAAYRLGATHFTQGEYPTARACFEQAVALFASAGDSDGSARALSVLSNAQILSGAYDQALESALRAQQACEELGNAATKFHVFNNAGTVYTDLGAFDEARKALDEARRLADDELFPTSTAHVESNLAYLAVTEARYRRDIALETFDATEVRTRVRACEDLLAAGQARGNVLTEGAALANVALGHSLLGEYALAQQYSARALQIATAMKVPLLRIGCGIAAADAALGLGMHDPAEQAATEALALARRFDNMHFIALAHRLFARLYEAMQRPADVIASERAFARAQHAELLRRSTHIARAHAWRQDLARRQRDVEALQEERSRLEKLAQHDALTGLRNRRFLDEYLRRQLDAGADLLLALVDVDRFKQINDNFSHRAGDEVLVAIATAMTASLRDTDFAVRLAGDEFIIVMPGATIDAGERVLQRVKESVRNYNWSDIDPGLQLVSVSIGLAQAKAGDTVESLVDAADREMYADKRRSRKERAN